MVYFVYIAQVEGLQVRKDGSQSLVASWDTTRFSNISGYQVFYHPASSTIVSNKADISRSEADSSGRVTLRLNQLKSFTTYRVFARLMCEGGNYGPNSTVVSSTTNATSTYQYNIVGKLLCTW